MFVECNGYLPIAVTLFATTLVAMFCLSGEKPNNSVIKPRSRSNSPYYYQSDSESDDELLYENIDEELTDDETYELNGGIVPILMFIFTPK